MLAKHSRNGRQREMSPPSYCHALVSNICHAVKPQFSSWLELTTNLDKSESILKQCPVFVKFVRGSRVIFDIVVQVALFSQVANALVQIAGVSTEEFLMGKFDKEYRTLVDWEDE